MDHQPPSVTSKPSAQRSYRGLAWPREPDHRRPQAGWWALAVVIHAIWAATAIWRGDRPIAPEQPSSPREQKKPSAERIRQALAEARQKRTSEPLPKREAKQKEPEKPLKGPIVDLPPSIDRREPLNPRRLAEFDSRAERETRARVSSSTPPSTSSDKRAVGERERNESLGGSAPARQQIERQSRAKRDTMQRGQQASEQTQPWRRLLPGPRRQPEPAMPPSSATPPLTLAQLLPQMGALSQQFPQEVPTQHQEAASPGGLTDLRVDEGDGNAMNARAFRYASFFNRMMRSVVQFWHPDRVFSSHDPDGQMFGDRSRSSVVEVVLNAQGQLVDAKVNQSSGLPFLDDEAVMAFRRAAPFNHPPKALPDADGLIRFQVDCHFTMHRGP